MAYKSLRHFIDILEAEGELARVQEFVSPHLEMAEITDRIVKNKGKALLFENNGTAFPLLINAFGSAKRMSLALGISNLDEVGKHIDRLLGNLLGPRESLMDKLRILPALKEMTSLMPKHLNGKGACQEVIMNNPDLSKIPVLTCWPADGGPFITLPVVHTKDADTGIRNTGMYRMQVLGNDSTGMHWHLHKGSAHHFARYRELGKRMPVTVTLGGDPVYTYVATAPLPENLDEYLLAGFLRKKKVGLVKCLTNDLEVPSDVDFVIEGYIDPAEEMILEGPFGDHTGFYSLADFYPKFHITCITHRKDAVYPATIVGIPPMEDEWLGKATERIFLVPIKTTAVPELMDMNMPVEGVFHNIVLAGIRKSYPGQGMKVMNALWGAGQMMFNKILIILSGEVNVQDCEAVAKAVSSSVDPLQDLQFIKGPVDILDHSSRIFALGSKIGIDATNKGAEELVENPRSNISYYLDKKAILSAFPDVIAINDQLPAKEISLLVMAVKKSKETNLRDICRDIMQKEYVKGTKFIVLMDTEVDILHPGLVAWICANNIDPLRDCFFVQNGNGSQYPTIFIDGTRKRADLDNFQRDWPNIIAMDETTIDKVDKNWEKYRLGPFIPSPSLRYKPLVISSGAIAVQTD